MLLLCRYTRHQSCQQRGETPLSWPSAPENMLSSFHSWEMWHLSLIPVGFVDYWVLRVTAASVSLAALIWAWRVLMALLRWPSPRVGLAKESAASLRSMALWTCLSSPLCWQLVHLKAGHTLMLQCSSSAAGGVGTWQGSVGNPLFCVCVGSSLAHGATGTSQIPRVHPAPTALAGACIANKPPQVTS